MADQRDHRGLSRALSAVTRMLGTGHGEGSAARLHTHSGRSAIVDCALYVAGEREPGHWHYEEALVEARRRPQAFVWLGLHEPREDELADIANTFELHELTIEDALKEFQRPKIERYGDMTFAVIRTTRYVEHTELTESSEVVETGSVSLFLGQHFVITIRTALAERADRLAAALREHIPGIRFTMPGGGYFLWVELPADVEVDLLVPAAAARGVAVVKGSDFLLEGGHHALRLAFCAVTPDQAEEGVRRLADAVREVQKRD